MIPRPGDHARNEITVLRLAGGAAAPGCCGPTPARGALLLERLGRPLHELGLPLARRLEILCATAAACGARRRAAGCPPARTRAAGSSATSQRPGPHSAARAPNARSSTRWPARPGAPRPMMTSGRSWSTATCTSGTCSRRPRVKPGFKLVDPDGLLAEAEYDLGVVMREDPSNCATAIPGPRAVAGPPLRPRCDRDLGVGRSGAGIDRAAVHHDRAAAGRPRDARHR